MPKLNLTDEELEHIKARRVKHAHTMGYNEAMQDARQAASSFQIKDLANPSDFWREQFALHLLGRMREVK